MRPPLPLPPLRMLLLCGHTATAFAGGPENPMPRADPRADPAALVHCDATVRISVLTPKIVRIERVPTASDSFEDRATLGFVNRRLDAVPAFTTHNTTQWCNISIQGGMTVSLRKAAGGGPSPPTPPSPPPSTCSDPHKGKDAVCAGHCARAGPGVLHNQTQASCCAACDANKACGTWILNVATAPDAADSAGRGRAGTACYLLQHGTVTGTKDAYGPTGGPTKILGGAAGPPRTQQYLRAAGVLQASLGSGAWTWNAWEPETKNLKGTLQPTPSADLAGCCTNPNVTAGEYDTKPHYVLQPGLLSRGGITAVDDSAGVPYDISNEGGGLDDAWLSNITEFPPVAGREDIYIFGCGLDYRGCLSDFVKVSGPMALPPLSALGVWWSRHWGNPHNIPWGGNYFGPMTESNILNKVAAGYEQRGLPLHVLVMDMEWHEMFRQPCYKSGNGNWGGYSWNRTLFPNPAAFVTKLHNSRGPLGVKVAGNTHQDVGIDACQDNYADFAEAIGVTDPGNTTLPDLGTVCGTEAATHYSLSCSRQYVDAYFKYMIEPMGMDYQWTDSPSVTTFTNELFVRYPGTKKKKRTVNFSRFGGLGQHRTPIGFSGDTARKWDTLAYQTYFTPHAANVGFGWWSHDIGGFSASPVDDVFHTSGPELYLRWLQFGAFAPIFRTHCRYCEQRIWTWGSDWYHNMRLPMTLRSNMVPYIYTHAALRSYTAGEALLTPTYYDPAAATADEAYAPEYGRQYLFGRQMLVAPVAYKVGGGPPQSPPENDTTWDAKDTRTASRSVWLPKGDWQAWSAAKGLPDALTPIHGPVVVTAEYGLNDIPVFVRAGAVIPTRTMSSAYHTTADPLVWQLAAPRGVGTGEGLVFEDDGESLEFRESTPSGATTSLTYTSAHEARLEATVGATNGSFTGMASVRAQWLVLYGQADEPKSATCDGAPLKPSSAGLGPGWWVAQPSAGHAGHPVHSKVGAARAAPATDDHEIIVYVPSLVVACDSAPTSVARTIKLAW